MDFLPLWLVVSVAVIYGLALGSFTTCVVYRVPRRLSLWRHEGEGGYRSFCPSCKHPLTARELIPVFSWLVQRGRCRHCGASIGVRYLLIELTVTMLVIGLALHMGLSFSWLLLSLLIPFIAGLLSFWLIKPKL